jgi:hypothetical protein
MLWRLAVRQFRDHSRDAGAPARCGGCHHPWPCSGRRLAELALITAGH